MSKSCDPNLKCVLKCALDISCLEMDIYLILLKNPGTDIEFIAETLQKDNNTIYKSLRSLVDKGLVKREYRILKSGGYKYLYYPIEFEEFKKIARKSLDEWFRNFEAILRSFEELKKDEFVNLPAVH